MERAGLTLLQEEVLDLMWSTTTAAPVGRRRKLPDGTYQLYKVERPTRPIDFAQENEFALKLHEKNPESPLSPYYINLRNMPDNLLTKVAEAIAEATQGIQTDFCTGIPEAGTPIALKYAEIAGIPYRKVFEKAKSGSGRKIVPALQHYGGGRKLLIIDDLITEADTKFEAAEAATEADYAVAGFAVLVDRQQGGRELLEEKGFRVAASILISQAFKNYQNEGKIDWSTFAWSMDYLNSARTKAGLPRLLLPKA